MKKLTKILPLLLIILLLAACGEEKPKEVKDMKHSISVNETTIGGTYSGTVLNELPEGEGTFISSEAGVYEYIGGWTDGEMTGNGKLTANPFSITLNTGDKRNGEYSGDIVGGVPEGKGTFKSQNQQGDKWIYEGEWKNGLWHGQGKATFDYGETRQGQYVNGEFFPAPLELFTLLFYSDTTVCPNAQEIINTNEDLFFGDVTDIPDELKDKSFSLAQFKKNPNSSIKGVIEVNNLTVVQIFEYDPAQIQVSIPKDKISYFIAGDWQYNYYFCYMVGGTPENVVEGSVINLTAVPLNYFTYKNTMNNDVWAVACAAIKIN